MEPRVEARERTRLVPNNTNACSGKTLIMEMPPGDASSKYTLGYGAGTGWPSRQDVA